MAGRPTQRPSDGRRTPSARDSILPSVRGCREFFFYFAECFILVTRQSLLLPSAMCLPSVSLNTLGKVDVCRVPDEIHSANPQALGNSTVSGSVIPSLIPNAAAAVSLKSYKAA